MPSQWHDAFVRLIKDQPKVPVKILRTMGVDIPDAPAYPASEAHNTRQSADLISDKTILVGPQHSPLRVIIPEVETSENEEKLRQIPRYAMSAWLWYECDVDVLVLCPDEKTAQYYGRPLRTAQDTCLYRPKVLLPSRVPVIRDARAVAADPELGLMSLIYHSQDPALAEAFAAGIAALGAEARRQIL